jgi:hypothetical protein
MQHLRMPKDMESKSKHKLYETFRHVKFGRTLRRKCQVILQPGENLAG